MMNTRRKLLLVFALLLSLCASGVAPAQDKAPLRKVTLLIYSNVPDLGDAPYWMVPHAMGYFAEEGLQVEPVY
ncbi:MAG TPA: hypothetical protein VKV24_09110, partial [Casimicrobiaceae bacterium]|nr:hypothetical protein [Casimicrobiaceae bacterium]